MVAQYAKQGLWTVDRQSVCVSQHSAAALYYDAFAAVGPAGRQEISVDCCTAGAQQQMRAVPRCPLT